MEQDKTRQDIVNLRAIAILTVVFGHSIIIYSDKWSLYTTNQSSAFLSRIKDVINVVQMPLFFSISGFCILYSLKKNQNILDFVKGKLKRIIVPFIVVGLAWLYPLRVIAHYASYEASPLMVIFKYIICGFDNGHLWFLPTLFIMLVVTYLINLIMPFDRKRVLFCVFVVFCACLAQGIPSSMPYFAQFGNNYIWFVLGLIVHLYFSEVKDMHISLKIIAAVFALASLFVIFCGFGNRIFSCIASVLCVLVGYALMPNKRNLILSHISRNSMGMYLFHSPLVYLTYCYLPNINPFLMVLINFVGFGTLAYFITDFMRRINFRFVIGE